MKISTRKKSDAGVPADDVGLNLGAEWGAAWSLKDGNPDAISRLLRSDQALSQNFRSWLANWLDGTIKKRRPKRHPNEVIARDVKIVLTHSWLEKKYLLKNKEALIRETAKTCRVSQTEVSNVLAAQNKPASIIPMP